MIIVDKIVHYSIVDRLSSSDKISVSIRISVMNFPIVETLEYHNEGKWLEDIANIDRTYKDEDTQKQWDSFKSRLLALLDDDNMRVIMDIMSEDDVYYSRKYNLEIIVNSFDIID